MKIRIVTDYAPELQELAAAPAKSGWMSRMFSAFRKMEIECGVVPFEHFEDGRPLSLACPNPWAWIAAFGDAEVVFCVTSSALMSGSYDNAMIAKREYERMNGHRHVFLVDGGTTGEENEEIVTRIHELLESGTGIQETYRTIREERENAHLLFLLNDTSVMNASGRIPAQKTTGVGVMGIRFMGEAVRGGAAQMDGKIRGVKRSATALVDRMRELQCDGGTIRISHNGNEQEAQSLCQLIQSVFSDARVEVRPMSSMCSYYAGERSLLVGFVS